MVDLRKPTDGDLIIYHEEGGIFLSRVTSFDDFVSMCVVEDLRIIFTTNVNHKLLETEISYNEIHKNFGTITIEEFEENYPEWAI